MLGDPPRVRGKESARVDQCGDAGDEKYDVEHEVEPGLGAGPHRTVEEVAADVSVLRQRIGPAEHEQAAVQHVVEVEYPGRRRIQEIALEDLDADDAHQDDDQPGCRLADPGGDAVNRMQDALDAHGRHEIKRESGMTKHHSVAPPNGALPLPLIVRSAISRSVRSSDRTPSSGS